MYSGSSLPADLNFHSVSGLYKNFTRISPSEFEFLINLTGEKVSKKVSVQESHFCSRNVGTDATFLVQAIILGMKLWYFICHDASPGTLVG
jgi:hypothetical protein